MQTHTHIRTHIHMHIRTHTHTHAHTHTHTHNTLDLIYIYHAYAIYCKSFEVKVLQFCRSSGKYETFQVIAYAISYGIQPLNVLQ